MAYPDRTAMMIQKAERPWLTVARHSAEPQSGGEF
jgi:hypothetical protein